MHKWVFYLGYLQTHQNPVLFGAGGNPYGTTVTVDQNGKMIEDVQCQAMYVLTYCSGEHTNSVPRD